MKLEKAPILHLFRLEIKAQNQPDFIELNQANTQAAVEKQKNSLLMQIGYEGTDGYKNYAIECFQNANAYQDYLNSAPYQQYKNKMQALLTNRVAVNLQPEFIWTRGSFKADNQAETTIYMTEIGVQLGQEDEFANGVLKEMKAATQQEQTIIAMIAGTVMDQPNEWLSLEVYQNRAAYQHHLQTKHFKAYLAATKLCVASKSLHLLHPEALAIQKPVFYLP